MGNALTRLILGVLPASAFRDIRLRDRTFHARVLEVYDGDTITVGLRANGGFWRTALRINGIDAPEIKPRRSNRTEKSLDKERLDAVKSRDFVREKILGKIILIKTNHRTDKFGRLLADIYINGGSTSLANVLVSQGLAVAYDGGQKPNNY